MNGPAAPADLPAGDRPFVARVLAETAQVAGVCDAADAHVAARGASERPRYALRVVLEELLTNVAKYASARGEVGVRVAIDASMIRVRVDDDGAAFDPTAAAAQPAPASLDAARVGGLGLRMVRSFVRSLRYRREAGRNVVDAEIDLLP